MHWYDRYVEKVPGVQGGEPVITGTRTPVRALVELFYVVYPSNLSEVRRALSHLKQVHGENSMAVLDLRSKSSTAMLFSPWTKFRSDAHRSWSCLLQGSPGRDRWAHRASRRGFPQGARSLMTGLGVTIYTDEDVDVDLARQLRYHGYDAVSCQETGNHNRGPSDEWQLTFASGERRAILVHNIADYCELDADWQSIGKAHHGIIAAQRMPIAQLVHRVRRHFDTVPPQQQYNTLLYLARG